MYHLLVAKKTLKRVRKNSDQQMDGGAAGPVSAGEGLLGIGLGVSSSGSGKGSDFPGFGSRTPTVRYMPPNRQAVFTDPDWLLPVLSKPKPAPKKPKPKPKRKGGLNATGGTPLGVD